MKYLFLNNITFEQKINATLIVVKETLCKLAILISKLAKVECEIIFTTTFPSIRVYDKTISDIIRSIDDRDMRIILLRKITKNLQHPFASDDYLDYSEFSHENETYDDYEVEGEQIDIFGTFIACAIFTNSPVLSADEICSIKIFKKDYITVLCNNQIHSEIINYRLSNSPASIYNDISKLIIDTSHSWNEWFNKIQRLEVIKLTEQFKNDIKELSYNSSIADTVRRHVMKMFDYQQKINSGIITIPNYSQMGINASDESDSVKNNPKLRRERKVIDCTGKENYAFWHSKLGKKIRIYFIPENEYICICRFLSKHPKT